MNEFGIQKDIKSGVEENLAEKVALFVDLDEEQMATLKEKFLGSLGEVTVEEIKETLETLRANGIHIKYARDVQVAVNTADEAKSKAGILDLAGKLDLAIQNPRAISGDCIGYNRRMSECDQNGISYIDDEGKIASFIKNDAEWFRKSREIEQLKKDNALKEADKIIANKPRDVVSEIMAENPERLITESDKEAALMEADRIIAELNTPDTVYLNDQLQNNFESEPVVEEDPIEALGRINAEQGKLNQMREDARKEMAKTMDFNFDFRNFGEEIDFEKIDFDNLGGGRRAA